MKFLEKEYPKGTFPGQKTDGAYINEHLSKNLDIYAEKIVDDMHFLIIISGNDSVGNGKSTLATHVATYLTDKINKLHGLNNTFTSENVALKADRLVEQSFKNPKYSVNLLDEGDDLTTHGMKQAAVELKRYFRKCRQLNQILILIIPSFFELPKFYALARSHSLINVKFYGRFDRGRFDFYGPKQKKRLYLKGKRDWDYDAANPAFNGEFFSQYTFFPDLEKEVEKYKKKKYEDMVEDSKEDDTPTPAQIMFQTKVKIFREVRERTKGISNKQLAEWFGISERTAQRYLSWEYERRFDSGNMDIATSDTNTNNINENCEVFGDPNPVTKLHC